jgi:hypothetical protein
MSDTRIKAGTQEQNRFEALARQNPLVDVDQLRQASALVKELRQSGVTSAEYHIESPYERRCVVDWDRGLPRS